MNVINMEEETISRKRRISKGSKQTNISLSTQENLKLSSKDLCETESLLTELSDQ